ncbi:MAG: primosomal protein N' [Rickettsiales bacterium]|nr:primosomal protein N' [Rickettsiales bacterium]
MIIEILLPLPLNKKTFYYKTRPEDFSQVKIGKLVQVIFRKKKIIGLIIKLHKKVDFNKKILFVENILENLFFSEEIIKSMHFISRYSCMPISMILKLFLSGFVNKKIEFKEKTINASKKNLQLTNHQKKALKTLENINAKKHSVITLHGVTGSGKTRVYMHNVIKIFLEGNQCLILVPEIILTKEWVNEIKKDFGVSPKIYHSSIKKSEKTKIWKSIILGKPDIIVGTRSSIFLPFSNLGLIVVDEEHDSSYKQEENLIINTRDFAIVRAKYSNCPIILSSATPSIETIFNCRTGKYERIQIEERINKVPLPLIHIIDKRKENLLISNDLQKTISENLKKKKQTLLFINKRGYAPLIICKKCGFSKICPNCSSSLVLHNYFSKESILLCHQCNHKERFLKICNNCQIKDSFIFPGFGIEKIYEEIKKLYPKANSLFISSDTIKNAKQYDEILKDIIDNKISIIIGTQLLSKGHNFPFLKTVGILNIDCLMNNFDFRSFEKTYQQIIQVSGRAGRKNEKGNVYIETFQPKHPVIEMCRQYKLEKYYEWELKQRKKNKHPPFSNFISIIISSKKESEAYTFSKKIVKKIRSIFNNIEVYGPAAAVIFKKNLFYRFRILIKSEKTRSNSVLKNYLKKISSPSNINFYIDVDPMSFF